MFGLPQPYPINWRYKGCLHRAIMNRQQRRGCVSQKEHVDDIDKSCPKNANLNDSIRKLSSGIYNASIIRICITFGSQGKMNLHHMLNTTNSENT